MQRDVVHRSAAVEVSQQVEPEVQRSIFDFADPRSSSPAGREGHSRLHDADGRHRLQPDHERTGGAERRQHPARRDRADSRRKLHHGGARTTTASSTPSAPGPPTQFEAIKDIGASIYQDISNFISQFKLTDLASPGDLWDRAKGIVERPIARMIAFAKALKDGIVTLVKNAILKPIAASRGRPAATRCCAR